jgi:hypothetical protein
MHGSVVVPHGSAGTSQEGHADTIDGWCAASWQLQARQQHTQLQQQAQQVDDVPSVRSSTLNASKKGSMLSLAPSSCSSMTASTVRRELQLA